MQTITERLAALSIQAKARAYAKKPRIRVHAGGRVTQAMLKIALGIETSAQKLQRWAESKGSEHVLGGTCPHCGGTGRYRFHTDLGRNEKCYRCNGKGILDARDLSFFAKRTSGVGPICWVKGALAA